jgi:hypothetical protein
MVGRLRAKPGGDAIAVTIGDIATTRVEGSFSLVYLVFNTIMNLHHPGDTGRVLPERGLASVARWLLRDRGERAAAAGLPPGETFHVFDANETYYGIDEYDVANPRGWSHTTSRSSTTGPERLSIPFRYVWPAELDLMAALAGMRLRERWGGWGREPFTSESRSHVSVWEKP